MHTLPKFLLALTPMLIVGASFAASPTDAKNVVETDSGVFWEPSDEANSNIVFYFPKTETVVTATGVSSAQVRGYTATLKPKMTTLPAIESVNPAWSGKSLRPFSIKASDACKFNETNVLFVNADIDIAGRTVSGADETICQFHFSIRIRNHDEVIAQVNAKAGANTLIGRSLPLSLSVASTDGAWTLPWSTVQGFLKPHARERFEHDEAVLLLGLALSRDAGVVSKVRALPSEERVSLVEQALGKVFVEGNDGRLSLVSESPTGQFTSNAPEVRHVSLEF